jgi:hypothetical protein
VDLGRFSGAIPARDARKGIARSARGITKIRRESMKSNGSGNLGLALLSVAAGLILMEDPKC